MTATYLLVVDFEATGKEPDVDEIIEAAFILVDEGLGAELGRWHAILPPSRSGLHRLLTTPAVREMHVANGLLNDLALSWHQRPYTNAADDAVDAHEHVRQFGIEVVNGMRDAGVMKDSTVHLAGSGIAAFDRPLIQRYMLALNDVLHYAPIDVGVPRRMIKMWAGMDISPDLARKNHRAMDDAEGHLNELRAVQRFLTNPVVETIYAVP